nr:MAG TPA: hypothetical protein [Caudoviricetes sp.]
MQGPVPRHPAYSLPVSRYTRYRPVIQRHR